METTVEGDKSDKSDKQLNGFEAHVKVATGF